MTKTKNILYLRYDSKNVYDYMLMMIRVQNKPTTTVPCVYKNGSMFQTSLTSESTNFDLFQ